MDQFDSEELEKELAQLMDEPILEPKENNISFPETPNLPVLPIAPNNKPILSETNGPSLRKENGKVLVAT